MPAWQFDSHVHRKVMRGVRYVVLDQFQDPQGIASEEGQREEGELDQEYGPAKVGLAGQEESHVLW